MSLMRSEEEELKLLEEKDKKYKEFVEKARKKLANMSEEERAEYMKMVREDVTGMISLKKEKTRMKLLKYINERSAFERELLGKLDARSDHKTAVLEIACIARIGILDDIHAIILEKEPLWSKNEEENPQKAKI